MLLNTRRKIFLVLVFLTSVVLFLPTWRVFPSPSDALRPWLDHEGSGTPGESQNQKTPADDAAANVISQSIWQKRPIRYPVRSTQALPSAPPLVLPKVQVLFAKESNDAQEARLNRRAQVKKAFLHCWESYRADAWMSDELAPISGSGRDPFGGWGATLVDSLDTLWIMGLRSEFDHAVAATANISFETTTLQEINVFETTIRYLGGFLSAHDLSGDERLLRKACEVGEMLYAAFDTPNRMPITRWNMRAAAEGIEQVAPENVLVAEIGSLTMEFTRLSMLTDDPKWFDAVQRIMDLFHEQQDSTHLPGMWPIIVNAKAEKFNEYTAYTLSAMADSLYEYLPKMHALLGGTITTYRDMYEKSMATAIKQNLFRPMVPDQDDILVAGNINTHLQEGTEVAELEPEGQHLVCFAGGMLALGGRLFGLEEHLVAANKLVDGCIWTYRAMPTGIMPERFKMIPCSPSSDQCAWDETKWKTAVLENADIEDDKVSADPPLVEQVIREKRIPKGFAAVLDARYILRPEAIESVFVLYRTTGREDLLESAWDMFQAIDRNTRTDLANAAIADVTVKEDGSSPKYDSMESFWMGETLKYFYLIFSEPELISLDDYVFNTEAHPFKRRLSPR